jgi:hypothetical protein
VGGRGRLADVLHRDVSGKNFLEQQTHDPAILLLMADLLLRDAGIFLI